MTRSGGLWQVSPKDRPQVLCLKRISFGPIRVTHGTRDGIMTPER
jgi:hypothetical protein